MTVTWYVSTKVDKDVDYSEIRLYNKVKSVLKNPKGWEYAFIDNKSKNKIGNIGKIGKIKGKYINFKFVPWHKLKKIKSKNKIPIRLSSNKTIQNICGFSDKLSCCDMETKEVWLNFYRWKNGATESKLPLYKYRNYMINHEVGHALGKLHTKCPCIGCSAPIMMQHTVSIGQCKPNDKPLKGE
jgi:hypothetical protein